MLNLDTHILIDAINEALRPNERALLSEERWGISSIVLWEIGKLKQLGRIAIDIDAPELAIVFSRVHVWPVDATICRATYDLDFKSDPADEIIAATSIVHRAPLVTRDRKLMASKVTPLALRGHLID